MKTKTTFKITTILLFTLILSKDVLAQNLKKSDDLVPRSISCYKINKVAPTLIKVMYSKPQTKKEKRAFNNSITYGQVWETGVDKITKVKFYQDVIFGNVNVKAGTYALLTIPGKKEWKVILSDNLDISDVSQYFPVFDVARITIPSNNTKRTTSFSIDFKENKDSVQMVLGMHSTRVMIPIKIKENKLYAKL